MLIKEVAKNIIIETAINFELPEEKKKEINEKRNYFISDFSINKIKELDIEHYYQGKGPKKGNFTYELEWNSKCLGSIGGGSVYKFGYENDFAKIKKYLIEILSIKNSINEFYKKDGELTDKSKNLIELADELKGIGRAFIGKILTIYFPEIFIGIYGHQDVFLEKIYDDYKPERYGVELYLRNNYLLLEIKNKYATNLTNDEFAYLLYQVFEMRKADETKIVSSDDDIKIEALEVQHYQSLIHRNFNNLFRGELKYYDQERQAERNGQFDTQEVGVMDFLCLDKNENIVVIELKRNASDVTLGQILRYMGWVNKNLCKKDQRVKGIILAESKDNRLEYALPLIPNVIFKKMKLNVVIQD